MTDIALDIALPLAVGAVLGLFYFGGLWLTVNTLQSARKPALLSLLSFVLRTGVTLLGFYLIMAGQLLRLLVCLAGFFTLRIILVRRILPGTTTARPQRERVGQHGD